jgi:hypothetical protein
MTDGTGRGPASEITVANLGASPATVGVALLPEGATGVLATEFPVTVTVLPAQTERIDGSRGVAARLRQRGFAIVADITPADCASLQRPYPAMLAVTSRLVGRRGVCEVASSWLSLNTSQAPTMIMLSPADAARADLEVGVANVSSQPLAVRVRLLDPRGARRGSVDRPVAALSFAAWRLKDLGMRMPAEGGRVEVLLADDADAWNPCRMAASALPCADPCDPAACPQRYRMPGFPAFFAFAMATGAGGEPRYLPGVVDQIGAIRMGTEYRQRNCPQAGGLSRLVDLFSRLALLRDPATLVRRPGT